MPQFYKKNDLKSIDTKSTISNYYHEKYSTDGNLAEKITVRDLELEHKEFLEFILKYLPSKTKSFTDKHHFEYNNSINTIQALKTSKWIEYNHSWLNMLIFDLDYKISIDEAINKCLAFEYEPTFVCETDKGVHIAFVLENMVSYEWVKAINLARYIKHEVTELLNADINGSHRLKGIWRNPLLHNYYFSGLTYNLDDFKYLLQKQQKLRQTPKENFKKYIGTKQRIELNNFSYRLGNRNAYLWYQGMGKIKDKDYNKIYDYLHSLNTYESLTQGIEKLNNEELKKIAYSILKYNTKETNFVTIKSEKKEVNKGVMKFEKIKKLSFYDYKQEVKKRQKLSAVRTNQLINEDKEKSMTRKEAVENMRKKKTEKAIKKLENAIRLLNLSNEKMTNAKIARTADLSRQTVAKYIDRYKDENGKIKTNDSLF